MDKEDIFSIIQKGISNLRYQFFIELILLLFYIFKLMYPVSAKAILEYINSFLPNFLIKIFSVVPDELRALILLITFFMVSIFILLLILAGIYEQNIVRVNYFNIASTISIFEKLDTTLANIIVFIFLFNLINDMSFTGLFSYFNVGHILILFIYIGCFNSFFLNHEK